jgi:hypothetical protein
MRVFQLATLVVLIFFAGCHSAFVDATVSNRTSEPIQLLEVDYPSASFGKQNLAAGQDFHYRFKILGDGKVKLTYTDRANREHSEEGPYLKEGSEGQLVISIAPDGVHWRSTLRP